jgi:hypothetical protein
MEISHTDALLWSVVSGKALIRYRFSERPRYKASDNKLSYRVLRSADLIYGIYLPFEPAWFRLIDNEQVVYEGPYPGKDGYLVFENPIPMCSMPISSIKIEYGAGEIKLGADAITKFLAPTLLCGIIEANHRDKLVGAKKGAGIIPGGAKLFANVVLDWGKYIPEWGGEINQIVLKTV